MLAAVPLSVEVDYWPAETGPFLWQAYDRSAIERDLRRLAARGIRHLRVGLAWDSFMVDDAAVDRRRLAELEHLLQTALATSQQITLGLFVWSVGDCVQLPAYAVLRGQPRDGVRVLSNARVEPGGPRDVYADALMLENGDRWLRTLLSAVGGHPAIAAWDLGDDPVRTVKPSTPQAMGEWLGHLGGLVRAAGDVVRLTAGAGDVTAPHGLPIGELGALVDRVDCRVTVRDITHLGAVSGAEAGLFLGELLRARTHLALPIGIAVPASDTPAMALREILERRHETGISALAVAGATGVRSALLQRAPFDRAPELGNSGLGDDATSVLADAARGELDVSPGATRLADIDWCDHDAHLPESLRDTFSMWKRSVSDIPALDE